MFCEVQAKNCKVIFASQNDEVTMGIQSEVTNNTVDLANSGLFFSLKTFKDNARTTLHR
jgi:hypothetical protein